MSRRATAASRCIALPIFPLRMAVWAYVFVRADSPIAKPSDLIGKKIGAQGYRYTVNLWLRGLFKEHYGFSPEQATWVTAETEGAGYVIPKGIKVEIKKGSTAEDNLKNGVVDAIWCTSVPQPFQNGESWIRRLFPDTQGEMQAFVRRTGIMPITHTLVMKKQLAEREPWIAESLYRMLSSRRKSPADEICQTDPKLLSLLDSVFVLEQQRAAYGAESLCAWARPEPQDRRDLRALCPRPGLYLAANPGRGTVRPQHARALGKLG